jgi:glutamyl-tRNA reductase
MRKHNDENYVEWILSAQEYEKDLAAKKLAQGQDPYSVMEEFSQRLIKKLLHPVYQQIQEENKIDIDTAQDRKIYEETYLKKTKPVADQVDGNLFDNF